MKFHKLTLIASFLLTFAMVIFGVIFKKVGVFQTEKLLTLLNFCGFVFMLCLNYFIIEILFSYYGRKQIRQISTILPEGITEKDNNMSFRELGERVSEFNQKNITKLDMMEEMEVYRKEYLGNISHELKTPLFSIQGYVETLMDGGAENIAIRDKYLERIDKSVERLLNIVKDLDMLYQYEYGQISLEYSKFDINALIKEIFDLFDLEAQKLNSKLILQTTQSQILVSADKQKISQVLLNLVSNALYYSNREEAKIILKTHTNKDKAFIEVIDNGMGIKPDILPRIFERFYRVESSRNRKQGGSGLGLAIVKHILEAHKENISVESIYLEGTTFRFQLKKA